MPTYKLTIISPEGQILDNEVISLVAPGTFGLFGVLANHAPMMMALVPGVLDIKDTAKEFVYAIDSGILEVHPDGNVLMLVDGATLCQTREEAKEKSKTFIAAQTNGQS